MRTTLTLEDDVAARLERVMEKRRQTLKAVVNDALRAGLDVLDKARPATTPYRIRPFNLGPSLVGSLDNVEEVLSRVEGEDHQ
jgi:hypothetical protein